MVNQVVATRGTVSVPLELVGLGDENAIGFSFAFDPGRLIYRSVTVNSGLVASAAVLNLNTNDVPAGRLGIAVSRQAGQTFPAGLSPLVTVGLVAGDVSGARRACFALTSA
jgi:hypothetical protein